MAISKIKSREDTATEALRLRNAGHRVVFTNGCFDLLHAGHIELLNSARRLGDLLVVAINSDESVRRLKGARRPIFPEIERAEILAALEMVDLVTIFGEDTPLETILMIHPDVLVKGADWVENVVGRQEVESWGGRVATVPLVAGQSTSGILERVLERFSSPALSRDAEGGATALGEGVKTESQEPS